MKECGYSDYYSKLDQKVNDPKMNFDPTSVEVTFVTLPKDHFIQVPRKYVKVCGYSDPFFQKLEPKVIDPWMTFDPKSVEVTCVTLPKDHCIQVPWKYIKLCGYSDVSSKTWTKGHWLLDDLLTPHLLRSQVWLYPRIIVSKSHGNTAMYVDTVINFVKYHILHTTYIHTTDRMSDHIVSFWTKFRRDKKKCHYCFQSLTIDNDATRRQTPSVLLGPNLSELEPANIWRKDYDVNVLIGIQNFSHQCLPYSIYNKCPGRLSKTFLFF